MFVSRSGGKMNIERVKHSFWAKIIQKTTDSPIKKGILKD